MHVRREGLGGSGTTSPQRCAHRVLRTTTRAACAHACNGAVVMRKNGVARALWLTGDDRGSQFLKNWMDFLEEQADLRYPNLADLYVDEQKGG